MEVKIEGTCEPRFRRVREIFADSFKNGLEVGAAVAAVVDGKTVFDLWGGYADKAKTKPWTRDTLVNVYSTTKGIASICAHRLVDQGMLDLDAPVSKYWPEFAQAGKEKIPDESDGRGRADRWAGRVAVQRHVRGAMTAPDKTTPPVMLTRAAALSPFAELRLRRTCTARRAA